MAHHLNASGTAAAVWVVFDHEIALGSIWPWLIAFLLLIIGVYGLIHRVSDLREAWDSANAPDVRP
jgi:hypothetical protein